MRYVKPGYVEQSIAHNSFVCEALEKRDLRAVAPITEFGINIFPLLENTLQPPQRILLKKKAVWSQVTQEVKVLPGAEEHSMAEEINQTRTGLSMTADHMEKVILHLQVN